MPNRVEEHIRKQDQEFMFSEDRFEIIPLSKSTSAIREPHHSEDVLSYTIDTNEGVLLIDTGMGLADISQVIPSDKPITVLLTHSHWDHIGGARSFKNIGIFNHEYETARLKRGWPHDETVGYSPEEFIPPLPSSEIDQFQIPGVESYWTFSDMDILSIYGLDILAIHTPGHTPGSASFLVLSTGELITGDTLYPGPEYLHLPESNVADYLRSLLKLKEIIKDQKIRILPGHNLPITDRSLLDNHIMALMGNIVPNKISLGKDCFNFYRREYFDTFSIMYPEK